MNKRICACPSLFLIHRFTLEGDSAHSSCAVHEKSLDSGELQTQFSQCCCVLDHTHLFTCILGCLIYSVHSERMHLRDKSQVLYIKHM